MPEPALPIPPAGAPRNPSDNDRNRSRASTHTSSRGTPHRQPAPPRRRPHLNERVLHRVVPMHPRRQVVESVRNRNVKLQRKPPTRRTRRTEQKVPPLPLRRPHDPRGQMQNPAKPGKIKPGRRTRTRPVPCTGQNRKRRQRSDRQLARQPRARQSTVVPLSRQRPTPHVVGHEIPQQPRVILHVIPAPAGFVRRQTMQKMRCRFDPVDIHGTSDIPRSPPTATQLREVV